MEANPETSLVIKSTPSQDYTRTVLHRIIIIEWKIKLDYDDYPDYHDALDWFMEIMLKINEEEIKLDVKDVNWFARLIYNCHLQVDHKVLMDYLLQESIFFFTPLYSDDYGICSYDELNDSVFLIALIRHDLFRYFMRIRKDEMSFVKSRINSPNVLKWLSDLKIANRDEFDFLFNNILSSDIDIYDDEEKDHEIAPYTAEDVRQLMEGKQLPIKYIEWAGREVFSCSNKYIVPAYTMPVCVGVFRNGRYHNLFNGGIHIPFDFEWDTLGNERTFVYPFIFIHGNEGGFQDSGERVDLHSKVDPVAEITKLLGLDISMKRDALQARIAALHEKLLAIKERFKAYPNGISIPVACVVVKGTGPNNMKYIKDTIKYLNNNTDGSIVYLENDVDFDTIYTPKRRLIENKLNMHVRGPLYKETMSKEEQNDLVVPVVQRVNKAKIESLRKSALFLVSETRKIMNELLPWRRDGA
jgi:hypothetical protein